MKVTEVTRLQNALPQVVTAGRLTLLAACWTRGLAPRVKVQQGLTQLLYPVHFLLLGVGREPAPEQRHHQLSDREKRRERPVYTPTVETAQ